MKKILIFAFLLGFLLVSCKDDSDNPTNNDDKYSIELISFDNNAQASTSDSDVSIHAEIKNNSTEDVTIKVTMIPQVANGHSTALCTEDFCFAPTIEQFEANFELEAGKISDDKDFVAYVYPYHVPDNMEPIEGLGSVKFIFDMLDSEGNVIEGKSQSFTVNYEIIKDDTDELNIEIISYDENPQASTSDSDVSIHAEIKNNSSEDLTIKVTMNPQLSDGHSAAICTNDFCYAPTIEKFESSFDLKAGEISSEKTFIAYVYPYHVPYNFEATEGTGKVEFTFDILDDDGNVIEGKSQSFTANYEIKP